MSCLGFIDKLRGRHRGLVVRPSHRRDEGRVAVKFIRHEIIYALHVVEQELAPEEAMPDTLGAEEIQLAAHHVDRPVTLAWREEIDAKSGTDDGNIDG